MVTMVNLFPVIVWFDNDNVMALIPALCVSSTLGMLESRAGRICSESATFPQPYPCDGCLRGSDTHPKFWILQNKKCRRIVLRVPLWEGAPYPCGLSARQRLVNKTCRRGKCANRSPRCQSGLYWRACSTAANYNVYLGSSCKGFFPCTGWDV